jgi:low affinity Fe/Cu permease
MSTPHPFERVFTRMADRIAGWTGGPSAFALALGAMIVWAILGPIVGFTELWQLAVNTGTTIITFLMVFIIQNSQNRDTRALQVKLDELIRATKGANNALLDLESMSASEIEALHRQYCAIAGRAKALGYDFDEPPPVHEASPDDADSIERNAAAA